MERGRPLPDGSPREGSDGAEEEQFGGASWDAVFAAVQALLDDEERLSGMSPEEHWEWARSLPASPACMPVPEV